jgi:hypothetical protein
MHLIRLPNRKEHRRAIMALLEVPKESLGLPDYKMVVTEEHIKALEKARIPFAYLSKTVPNGADPTPFQS